jgi:acyl-CoA dehydrogenase
MGFTQEYPLHHATRRLWAWRDEFGTEDEWAARLGESVLVSGAPTVWRFITSSPGQATTA